MKKIVNGVEFELTQVELEQIASDTLAAVSDDAKRSIKNQIIILESQITPRRIREALTDVQDAKAWLTAKENELQALRDELAAL